jgi:hypothetical protein
VREREREERERERERERETACEPGAYLDEGNEYVSEIILPLVCVETFVLRRTQCPKTMRRRQFFYKYHDHTPPGKGVRPAEK